MRRLLRIMRDPVAWILIIAGIVEMVTGGTAARGAILFAGSALIMADRIRAGRDRTHADDPILTVGPLQDAVVSRGWLAVAAGAVLLAATFASQSTPMTATVGIIGILVVGWAWLTGSTATAEPPQEMRGLLVWGALFLMLGLWELTALLGQPSFSETSYDSPTISYLLEPVLDTYPGRVAGLGLWALAGRGLIRAA